jgi:hypothetical protein
MITRALRWDDEDRPVEELTASTGDYRVARAAYEEAVKRRLEAEARGRSEVGPLCLSPTTRPLA